MNNIVQNQITISSFKEAMVYCFLIGSMLFMAYILLTDLLPSMYAIYCDGLSQSDKPAIYECLIKAIFVWIIATLNYFIVLPRLRGE